MIAALIFVISITALLQFFISYCRSIIAASHKQELSEQAREAAEIANGGVRGEEFGRLVLLAELCPEPGDDATRLRAVRWYFALLSLLRRVSEAVAPGVTHWAELERQGCAYFAAVTLDRRMAYSRSLMAQHMYNRL